MAIISQNLYVIFLFLKIYAEQSEAEFFSKTHCQVPTIVICGTIFGCWSGPGARGHGPFDHPRSTTAYIYCGVTVFYSITDTYVHQFFRNKLLCEEIQRFLTHSNELESGKLEH